MISDDLWGAMIAPAIEKATEALSNKYAMEREETVQDAWVYALENRRSLESTLSERPDMLSWAVYRGLQALYFRERIKIQSKSGAYFYEPVYVRLFLPYAFALQDWANGPTPGDTAPEFRNGEAVDTAIDITMAWPRIRPQEQRIIMARHVSCTPVLGQVDWQTIADLTGRATPKAAQAAYHEATKVLTYHMNNELSIRSREHEGAGSRKALSNSASRARLSSDYDGDTRKFQAEGTYW